ncbi:MAG: AraC family transcriptional regulator [Oculatellaceae cyanobacterium bins.114]|nr:AraC family transcriptional regulator [Oculatellaceae cyanobacterium bins.114]
MPEPAPLTVDLKENEPFLKIFPRSPLQVSDPTLWQGIFLAHHRQPAWEMPENQLSQHVLSINIGATRKVERRIDGQLQRERFLTGDVAIYPAGIDYTLRWEQESEFILIGIDPGLLAQNAIALSETETVELKLLLATQDSLIHSMALALKAELEAAQPGGRLYAEAIAQTLAIHLLRNYSVRTLPNKISTSDGLPKHKLHQIIDYIHNSLHGDLSLSQMATVIGMSAYHFSRLFKQSTGLSPYQYVIQCRLERAKELLQHSDLTIAQIAYTTGFSNQSHLTQQFKRHYQTTPQTLRD